jgi:hypothetical protein
MIQYPNTYDNMTLFCYPGNAGGNFLINCLSLSDQAVFRDALLIKKQIAGEFGYQEKIAYLHDKLDLAKRTGIWNDLNLGCEHLFGINNRQYLFEYHQVLKYRFSSIVQEVIDHNLNLYLVSHGFQFLKAHLKFWPHARVVMFVNWQTFVKQRNGKLNSKDLSFLTNYWNTVRGESWPITPPVNQQEFDSLDPAVGQELKHDFDNEISRWFDRSELIAELYHSDVVDFCQEHKDRCYIWDTDLAYSSGATFLKHFEPCRDWLGLPKTNNQDLVDYFEHWTATIKTIKSER